MLLLKKANLEDSAKEWEFVKDMPEEENGLTNTYHNISEREFTEVVLPQMLPQMIDRSYGKGVPEDRVPDTILFLWDDEEIVGQFRIRHRLNESLRERGGHIGYYIAPQYRGRGYATRGLALALGLAKELVEEDEILFSVCKDNTASQKVILSNGGRVVREDESRLFLAVKP